VFRQQSHVPNTEVDKDLRPNAVVAGVLCEAKLEVRFHRVASAFLQRVGAELVRQPDRAALVAPNVQDHAPPLFPDMPNGVLELGSAVTPKRPEDVARKHSECTRTRMSRPSPTSPSTIATCTRPSTR